MGEARSAGGRADDMALARAVGAAVSTDRPGLRELKDVVALAGRSAARAGGKAVGSGRWFAEVALAAAEHLPVRDRDTLREHFDGLEGSLLAGALIRSAGNATAAVGAATGALAAASETTPATWATLPVELAAETMVVVAIEMKLVGELHEAAGVTLPPSLRDKGPLIARAWAESRGLRPQDVWSLTKAARGGTVAGTASELLGRSARDQLTNQLRRRLLRRAGRNLTSLAPFLIGAAAGAALNKRATGQLGTKVATSLGIPPPG